MVDAERANADSRKATGNHNWSDRVYTQLKEPALSRAEGVQTFTGWFGR